MTAALVRWVVAVSEHARLVLLLTAVVTAAAGWVAWDRFKINSELADLIRMQADWRTEFDTFRDKFPLLVDTAFVVVSGDSFEAVEDVAKEIEAGLLAQPLRFSDVYAPSNDPFFADRALLYADVGDLEGIVDRLAEAQPVLTAVAEDPSLRGVLDLVVDGLENEPGAGFDRILRVLGESAEAVANGDPQTVRWADELFESDREFIRIVFLKGFADFGAALPNAVIVAGLRDLVRAVDVPAGVDVAITGEVALAHEEIEAAQKGVQLAGLVSLGLLALVLGVGVRSVKIIAATFVMLLVGVTWTAAYAMLTVGEFNTLSIIFVVMFFGLGVDFAIHFSLRYTEAVVVQGAPTDAALGGAAGSVGHAILLCTATTAIGFLGFVPTDYKGLADLGIISSGGMVISCVLTFTLLPALYAAFGPPRGAGHIDLPSGDSIVRALLKRRFVVLGVVVVLAVGSAALGTAARFDYSVLALRDPDSESMSTLRRLQEEEIVTDYTLSVLTPDVERTRALADLEALPSVGEVRTPFDYVPDDQDDKLFLLEDARELLWSALAPARAEPAPSTAALRASMAGLEAALDAHMPEDPTLRGEAVRLQAAIRSLDTDADLLAWQRSIVAGAVDQLDWLARALDVDRVEFDDLPAPLRRRVVSLAGEYHSVVLPAEDISDVNDLSRFIGDVRAQVPFATGRPVVEWGVGGIVVDSFTRALAFALLGILAVLALALRNAADTVLVFVPLLLAAAFTVAATVVFNTPLNMANILVLPLIFGLGVDNGIHVVERYRRMRTVSDLMHSSTPRAVVLSTLTTIGTFAALMLSPHQGTASIGMLLTVAVGFLLVFTVFLLPVLLSFLKGHEPAA